VAHPAHPHPFLFAAQRFTLFSRVSFHLTSGPPSNQISPFVIIFPSPSRPLNTDHLFANVAQLWTRNETSHEDFTPYPPPGKGPPRFRLTLPLSQRPPTRVSAPLLSPPRVLPPSFFPFGAFLFCQNHTWGHLSSSHFLPNTHSLAAWFFSSAFAPFS